MFRPDQNSKPNPVLPPHDLSACFDQRAVVAGAKALIGAALSETPEAKAKLELFEKEVLGPFNDDLQRIEILEMEGFSTDEAWDELDRIKRQAGRTPQ